MNPPLLALAGDLSVISLFDLGQLLRLNGATGCLTIRDGSRNGALYFDGGELINAVDDARNQGEEAAIGLFSWRGGSFEFRAEPPIGGRVIQSSTEAIMMEAARRLDEQSIGTVEHVDDSETRRLQDHQAAMEALREAFLRVAGEASADPSRVDALSVTIHLYQLTEPEDRLLYRPGLPPYLRRRGRWSPVPESPLTREDYARLCQRLSDACDPLLIGDPDPSGRRRMTLANGRVLILDTIGQGDEESLWVRPSGAAPPGFDTVLEGDLSMLSTLVELPESLLVLGARDLATARRLLAATAALGMGPADTLLLVSPDGGGRIRTERGVSLATTPQGLRTLLEVVRPDVVALDPALGTGQLALDDLAAVPRILAAAVGQDPASLPARWVFRVPCRRRVAGRAWLSTMLRGVVTARATETAPAVLTVSAWALDLGERELALRGEIEALGARLDARAAA